MKKLCLLIIASLAMAAPSYAEVELKTDEDKVSYTIGIQIGNDLGKNPDFQVEALLEGIRDAFKGGNFKITTEEMQAVMERYQEEQFAKQLESSQDNKEAGTAFLAANKEKDGVIETDSGLQYKVLKEGTGKQPTASDNVEVHYHGQLIDGTVFDSSVERGEPITLGVGNVIKGWQEALSLMKEGAKWQLYIPSDLAYGERGAGGTIGPNSALIFDVELIEIK